VHHAQAVDPVDPVSAESCICCGAPRRLFHQGDGLESLAGIHFALHHLARSHQNRQLCIGHRILPSASASPTDLRLAHFQAKTGCS
jgi:hypothetical protein